MNIVTIETKRGYTIKIPVWTIKGLIVQPEKGEYFLSVSGSNEPYPISKESFSKVEAEWISWTTSMDIQALTAINVAEQVGNELSSLISSTNSAITSIATTATGIEDTNVQLRRTIKNYQSEVVGCIKDVTSTAKTVIKIAQETLKTSEAAVDSSNTIAQKLKTLAKSIEDIDALELFR